MLPRNLLKEQITGRTHIPLILSPSLRDHLHQRAVDLTGINTRGKATGLVPDRRPTILQASTIPLGFQTSSASHLHQHPVQRRGQHRRRAIFPVPAIPTDSQLSSGPTIMPSAQILSPNPLQTHSPTFNKAAPRPFLVTSALGLGASLRLPTPNSTVNRHRTQPSRPLSRTVPRKHSHHLLLPPPRIHSRPIQPTTPLTDGQRPTRTSI